MPPRPTFQPPQTISDLIHGYNSETNIDNKKLFAQIANATITQFKWAGDRFALNQALIKELIALSAINIAESKIEILTALFVLLKIGDGNNSDLWTGLNTFIKNNLKCPAIALQFKENLPHLLNETLSYLYKIYDRPSFPSKDATIFKKFNTFLFLLSKEESLCYPDAKEATPHLKKLFRLSKTGQHEIQSEAKIALQTLFLMTKRLAKQKDNLSTSALLKKKLKPTTDFLTIIQESTQQFQQLTGYELSYNPANYLTDDHFFQDNMTLNTNTIITQALGMEHIKENINLCIHKNLFQPAIQQLSNLDIQNKPSNLRFRP